MDRRGNPTKDWYKDPPRSSMGSGKKKGSALPTTITGGPPMESRLTHTLQNNATMSPGASPGRDPGPGPRPPWSSGPESNPLLSSPSVPTPVSTGTTKTMHSPSTIAVATTTATTATTTRATSTSVSTAKTPTLTSTLLATLVAASTPTTTTEHSIGRGHPPQGNRAPNTGSSQAHTANSNHQHPPCHHHTQGLPSPSQRGNPAYSYPYDAKSHPMHDPAQHHYVPQGYERPGSSPAHVHTEERTRVAVHTPTMDVPRPPFYDGHGFSPPREHPGMEPNNHPRERKEGVHGFSQQQQQPSGWRASGSALGLDSHQQDFHTRSQQYVPQRHPQGHSEHPYGSFTQGHESLGFQDPKEQRCGPQEQHARHSRQQPPEHRNDQSLTWLDGYNMGQPDYNYQGLQTSSQVAPPRSIHPYHPPPPMSSMATQEHEDGQRAYRHQAPDSSTERRTQTTWAVHPPPSTRQDPLQHQGRSRLSTFIPTQQQPSRQKQYHDPYQPPDPSRPHLDMVRQDHTGSEQCNWVEPSQSRNLYPQQQAYHPFQHEQLQDSNSLHVGEKKKLGRQQTTQGPSDTTSRHQGNEQQHHRPTPSPPPHQQQRRQSGYLSEQSPTWQYTPPTPRRRSASVTTSSRSAEANGNQESEVIPNTASSWRTGQASPLPQANATPTLNILSRGTTAEEEGDGRFGRTTARSPRRKKTSVVTSLEVTTESQGGLRRNNTTNNNMYQSRRDGNRSGQASYLSGGDSASIPSSQSVGNPRSDKYNKRQENPTTADKGSSDDSKRRKSVDSLLFDGGRLLGTSSSKAVSTRRSPRGNKAISDGQQMAEREPGIQPGYGEPQIAEQSNIDSSLVGASSALQPGQTNQRGIVRQELSQGPGIESLATRVFPAVGTGRQPGSPRPVLKQTSPINHTVANETTIGTSNMGSSTLENRSGQHGASLGENIALNRPTAEADLVTSHRTIVPMGSTVVGSRRDTVDKEIQTSPDWSHRDLSGGGSSGGHAVDGSDDQLNCAPDLGKAGYYRKEDLKALFRKWSQMQTDENEQTGRKSSKVALPPSGRRGSRSTKLGKLKAQEKADEQEEEEKERGEDEDEELDQDDEDDDDIGEEEEDEDEIDEEDEEGQSGEGFSDKEDEDSQDEEEDDDGDYGGSARRDDGDPVSSQGRAKSSKKRLATKENVKKNVKRMRPKESKKHRCEVCSKKFSRPSQLVTHSLTHSGERPYSCSTCRKTFNVASNLKRHNKTHLNAKKSSTAAISAYQDSLGAFPVGPPNGAGSSSSSGGMTFVQDQLLPRPNLGVFSLEHSLQMSMGQPSTTLQHPHAHQQYRMVEFQSVAPPPPPPTPPQTQTSQTLSIVPTPLVGMAPQPQPRMVPTQVQIQGEVLEIQSLQQPPQQLVSMVQLTAHLGQTPGEPLLVPLIALPIPPSSSSSSSSSSEHVL